MREVLLAVCAPDRGVLTEDAALLSSFELLERKPQETVIGGRIVYRISA